MHAIIMVGWLMIAFTIVVLIPAVIADGFPIFVPFFAAGAILLACVLTGVIQP